jgi:hypothetical protein
MQQLFTVGPAATLGADVEDEVGVISVQSTRCRDADEVKSA